METRPQPLAAPRGNKRTFTVLVILGSVLLLALLAGGAYLLLAGQDTTGLEGSWRDPANPRHTHQFRSSGDMDAWLGVLPMACFATWRRDGQKITVRTERNWDFVGQLEGGTIRGKMLIRDEKGAIVNETDTVWVKE